MPKASFECELCKKPIARRSLLSIHAHNYHSPKYTVNVPSTSGTVEVIHVARDEHGLVNCTICNASYKSINALRNHATRLCMNKDVTTCPYCNAAINNKLYLIQHINESHKPQAKVKIVTESGGLEEITLTRGEDAKFKCLFCNIKHKWSYAIRDHILYCPNNTKDKPKIADLSCPFCEKVCESKIKLDKHRNNNHNKTVAIKIPAGSGWKEVTVVRNEEGKLPCPLCGNHYSSTGSIRLHIRRNCLKGVPSEFKCMRCKSFFRSKEGREKHDQERHTAKLSLKYQSESGALKIIDKEKDDLDEFDCPQCGHGFVKVSKVIEHISKSECSIINDNEVEYKYTSFVAYVDLTTSNEHADDIIDDSVSDEELASDIKLEEMEY